MRTGPRCVHQVANQFQVRPTLQQSALALTKRNHKVCCASMCVCVCVCVCVFVCITSPKAKPSNLR